MAARVSMIPTNPPHLHLAPVTPLRQGARGRPILTSGSDTRGRPCPVRRFQAVELRLGTSLRGRWSRRLVPGPATLRKFFDGQARCK